MERLIIVLTLFLQTPCSFVSASSRNLEAQFNPECDIKECLSPTKFNLVHIKAEGADDVLHYLWSTFPTPSLLMAQTSLNTSLHVNWTLFNESSSFLDLLSFNETPMYTFLTTFNRIIEFNDTEGKANVQKANHARSIEWGEFEWDNANASIHHRGDHIVVLFKSSNSSLFNGTKSSVSLELQVYQEPGHANDVPMLFHTDKSSQIAVVLDNLPTHWPNSRFALELSQAYPNSTDLENKIHPLTKREKKNINDEYSPGVFTIISFQDHDQGYIFWKPVAYLTPEHALTKSIDARLYDLVYSTSPLHPFLRLGTEAAFNISFGTEDDGFYAKNHYNAWTFVVGQGEIPQEKPSLLYYILFGIGFGLPGCALVGGGLYLAIHYSTKKEEDEELLTT